MAVNIRFKGLVATLAQIAVDKFAGRIAWASDIARMIMYYDSNNYGTMARRDVLETFSQGIQDSTITSGQALVAGASGRIQSQDAATFRNTIGASPEYPFIVFPAPDPVRNHVDISVPDDGEFIDNVLAIQNKSHGLFFGVETWGNAAINFKDSAGTERCAVGYSRNSAIQPTGYIADTLYCEIGNPFTSDAQATYFRVMATIKAGSPYWGGAAKQWAPVVISSRTGRIDLDAGGGGQAVNVINGPLTVGERDDVQPLNIELTNSAARIREFAWSDYLAITTNIANLAPPYTLDDNAKSAWILGLGYGSGAGEFDSLQVKRVPAGGGSATTLFRVSSSGVIQASSLSGTGSRPLVADASGNVDDQDAATFRGTIGIPDTVTREMIIQPLPITNSAPGVVTVGPSGSMRSFGFDGNTQVEELFYHVDLQHDYISGTDIIPHVHWVPSTNGTGDVVWKWDYQWVETGGTFGAPTTAACPAVAAGGTAWADKRSQVTISGAGHTYNSRLLLRLYRDPNDGADTYGADAVLSSVGVHYSANPLQVG